MSPGLMEKLERLLPIRVVARIEDGRIEGRVENSFSMDWEKSRINIFWSGKAYSMLGEHNLDGVSWAKSNVNQFKYTEFVLDPMQDDCPIEIDWESWLTAQTKYDKRNAPFKTKPGGAYQLRAMAAERELAVVKPQLDNVCKQCTELEDKLDSINALLNPTTTEEE